MSGTNEPQKEEQEHLTIYTDAATIELVFRVCPIVLGNGGREKDGCPNKLHSLGVYEKLVKTRCIYEKSSVRVPLSNIAYQSCFTVSRLGQRTALLTPPPSAFWTSPHLSLPPWPPASPKWPNLSCMSNMISHRLMS